jgi:hypothetical protein
MLAPSQNQMVSSALRMILTKEAMNILFSQKERNETSNSFKDLVQ